MTHYRVIWTITKCDVLHVIEKDLNQSTLITSIIYHHHRHQCLHV